MKRSDILLKHPKIDWQARTEEELSGFRRSGYFYVACSEFARTPSEIDCEAADDTLIHNNLANLIIPTDLNCISAMQYAIEILHVENILICGHYGCKGVTAALDGCRLDFLGNWLRPVIRTAGKYKYLLNNVIDKSERNDILCKLNVAEQVLNASRTSIVQKAWHRGQNLTVRGIIYDQKIGSFADVTTPVEDDNSVRYAYDQPLSTLLNKNI